MLITKHGKRRARERLTNDLNELNNLAKKAFRYGQNIPQGINFFGQVDYSKVVLRLYKDYYWVFEIKPKVKLLTLYKKGNNENAKKIKE